MKPASLLERLLSWRVINEITGCWLPKRCYSYSEYFKITYDGKRQLLHRLSAIQFLNLDPNSDMQANHKPMCPFKACFNPEHIYVGTAKQNNMDYSNTITHCPQGHLYDDKNTYRIRLRHGSRKGRMVTHCRACDRERHKII